eukprot:415685_1
MCNFVESLPREFEFKYEDMENDEDSGGYNLQTYLKFDAPVDSIFSGLDLFNLGQIILSLTKIEDSLKNMNNKSQVSWFMRKLRQNEEIRSMESEGRIKFVTHSGAQMCKISP